MYSGQGSQYYNMGRELYLKNEVFRKNMQLCDSILRSKLDKSLISVIYDGSKQKGNFEDILYTHPAIFCFGYCLTQVLYDKGIYPNSVLGYSLGEYTAAAVSGMISLEEGLNLVVKQSKMLHAKCNKGGMMVVFDEIDNYIDNQQLYQNCILSGINYQNCYVVSGVSDKLNEVASYLSSQSVRSFILPVKYAFHSELIEPIKKDFLELIKTVSYKSPKIPVYSCASIGELSDPDNHFWDVIRNKIQFRALVSQMNKQNDCLFVDVSPTGTLCNFIKYGFKEKIHAFTTINQFGKNLKSLQDLETDLNNVRGIENLCQSL